MQHVRAAGDAQCTPFASLCRSLVGWPDGLDGSTDRHACSKRDDIWSRLPPVASEHSCSGLFSLMRRSKSMTSSARGRANVGRLEIDHPLKLGWLAALPRSVMNSRRLMGFPPRPGITDEV